MGVLSRLLQQLSLKNYNEMAVKSTWFNKEFSVGNREKSFTDKELT
jgi:hypothetical protein